MKKIIYSVAAMALAFFSVSCQQENLESAAGGTVTYTVQVPDAIATKAIGDGISGVTELIYEVYKQDEAGNLTEVLYESIDPVTINSDKKFTFDLEFIKNHNYTVLFWAYNPNAPENCYDIEDLRAVKLSQTLVANNEAMAVFAGSDQVVNCQSTSNGNVTLVRPVAQINVVTNNESLAVGTRDITLMQSSLKVKGLSTTYNVADKSVASEEKDFAYEVANIPSDTFTIGTEDYKYVAMNYVGFASELGDNVDLELTIKTSEGDVYHKISNIPVKPNYRTNIYGNLITASADYAVELKKDWSDPTGGNMEAITEGLIKNINGDYEVSEAAGLAYAINNLFVDANDVANTATFYVKPGLYEMAQHALNDITVTSGTLKVYDTEAVVTRSATTSNVIITGLKKALIEEVGEDATVFFSGITITDFNGADNAAALVQNNEGKVVLADCQILDENGAPDQDTELVDGNEPVEVKKGEEAAGDLIYTAAQLADAFANESVKSIVLGADITLENTLVFPEGRTATLDLRGWELTVNEPASNYAINNHGTLTIKDSYATGEVNARGIYNGYLAEGAPILTIESGTFNAMGENGGAAIFNYGIADIKGGSFTSIGGYSLNNQEGSQMTIADGVTANNGVYSSNAKLTINGGNISGNRSGCHVVYCWNTEVTINGGEFYNNNSGNSTVMAAGTTTIVYNGGTFGIKDGRVEGNANTWTSCLLDSADSAVATITDGTYNGGFRVQAGTSMTITGGTFNDCFGSNYNIYGSVSITGGTYTDVTAKAFATQYADEDYKLVDETVVPKVYTVQVGDAKYETLQEAVDNAMDGSTIKFITDIEQRDGVLITDKNLTIDLNDKTFTVSEGANTNNRNFKINGSSVVTIKNGTMVANGTISTGAYGTVCTEDSANVTLNDVKSYSYRGYGLNVKACAGTTITISDSEIYAQYSGGVEAAGGIIILDNVNIDQRGVDSAGAWCSVAIGVNGGGKVTVNSGEYSAAPISTDANAAQGTWVAYVMSSGGTLEINGGTFNGTIAETAAAANACGIICADAKAVVDIHGGTFNSNGAILDMRNNTGATPNPVATLYGGTFSADPSVSGLYGSNLISVAEGYEVYQEDDLWKIGEEGIRSWDEFTAALAANETEFKLQADITYDENYQLQKAVTIDLNEKSMTLPMINIHAKTTIKNGTINGKVYARKNSEVVFDGVIFSGAVADNLSTEGHLAIQGGCKSLYANNCKFSPTSVSGSQTKPLSFEGGSTQIEFENCEFKSSPYKKQVYLNSLSATGSIVFTNCNFNNKTPNIMFAANCPLTNITMSGTTKLSSVTFEINRAKDAVTETEWAHISSLIANNSFSSVRVFYAGGSSEYIK